MITDIELTQYLSAKFCHELAGTLGAINNGVEFLEEAGEDLRTKAADLINVSSKQAIARLLFYRQAYGVAKFAGEADLGEIRNLIIDFLKDSKITLNFNDEYVNPPEVSVGNNDAKVLLCLIVIAAKSLLKGGTITVSISKNSSHKLISIIAEGSNVKNDDEVNNILMNKLDNIVISTVNVHPYYTMKLAEQGNGKIKIVSNKDKLEFLYQT